MGLERSERLHRPHLATGIGLALLLAGLAMRPATAGPLLEYCGYIGGDTEDFGYGVAVDSSGAAYVVGTTGSLELTFPVGPGPDLSYNGNIGDAFVAKVAADGNRLDYCGYVGGLDWDDGQAIAVDGVGRAYITGWTRSTEASFPAVIGPDLTQNSGIRGDAFVARVVGSGLALEYSGFIGGSVGASATAVSVDGVGNAWLAGDTNSTEVTFPVLVGPDLTHNGSDDVFVAKVKADGSTLLACGYIGGEYLERATGIGVDGSGRATVAGYTGSSAATFPVLIGPDLSFNDPGPGEDAFVARLKLDGSGLEYAGYLGGARLDESEGMAVDAAGSAVLAGSTTSGETTFPVAVGPDLTFHALHDGFVARVSSTGMGLEYAGYIGGTEQDYAWAVAVDSRRNAYVAGSTGSDESSFPVVGGPDTSYNLGGGAGDAFIAMVNSSGSNLVYAGYLGGFDEDLAYGVAVDGSGRAYLAGKTLSNEATFPVLVGPTLTFDFQEDAFVARVGAVVGCAVSAVPITGLQAVKSPGNPDDIELTWTPDLAGSGYNLWYVPDASRIPEARQSGQPVAIPVVGCATPVYASSPACTDPGAVSRSAPAHFYYQAHTYCDASSEGP